MQKASKHVLVDDELFKRSQEELLLKYVNDVKAKWIMHELHEGIVEHINQAQRWDD